VKRLQAFAVNGVYAKGDDIHLFGARRDVQRFLAVSADWLQEQGAL
jgi:hypothetical protein